jgi:hypothetical protein
MNSNYAPQGWVRKEFVTRGPDPTVVVTWTKGFVTLTEFQAVYQMTVATGAQLDLVEELHRALEHIHHLETQPSDDTFDGDPDAAIYGEP